MSKRTSGLGRGLGDLLADNSPEIRGGATVIRRNKNGEATVTPDISDGVESAVASEIYGKTEEKGEKEAVILTKSADISAADHQPRIIIGGESASNNAVEFQLSGQDASQTETRTARRSLKALFKSYK